MTQELWEIVREYQNKGVLLMDHEAEEVCDFCHRKMEVAQIQNREEYLPLLYADELGNYLFHRALNAMTVLQMMGKEVPANVQRMYEDTMSSKMSECLGTEAVVPV